MTGVLTSAVSLPNTLPQVQTTSFLGRTQRLLDKLSLYAPLLMMGFLASGTYWLVRNTPKVPSAVTATSVKHEVDYFLQKFTLKSYNAAGFLKSELRGAEGRHFPDTDILEIDMARLHNINPAGDVINATGNRAYSNGDGSEIQLIGDAMVVREPRIETGTGDAAKPGTRLEFKGDFLHVFLNEERVKSHKPVVLIRGADRFSGDSFEYNNLDGVANLTGRVKGLLVPRASVKAPP